MSLFYTFITIAFIPTDLCALQNYLMITYLNIDSLLFDYDSSVLTILSQSIVTDADQTILEGLLSTYIQVPIINYGLIPINISNMQVSSVFWSTIASYEISVNINIKTLSDPNLINCQITTFLIPNTPNDSTSINFNYTIRIVDITTNTILGSNTFNNSNVSTMFIPLISIIDQHKNIKNNNHILEIQCQKNTSGSFIQINSIYLLKML